MWIGSRKEGGGGDGLRRPFALNSFFYFLFFHFSVSLSVPQNLSQSLSFFLLFFVLSCCTLQPLVSPATFLSSLFLNIFCPLPVSFSVSHSLFLFLLPCFSRFHPSLFLSRSLSLSLSVPPFLFLSLFLSSVTFGTSLPAFLYLCLFLVLSLTMFCSPCASVCVCLFSWCLKLPLLQSGCWDSGPKLPALSPRPLHFLNFLQRLLAGGEQDAGKTGRRETPGVWAQGLSALPAPGQ